MLLPRDLRLDDVDIVNYNIMYLLGQQARNYETGEETKPSSAFR